MLPREQIGRAMVPGGVELRLIKHGRDFMIVLDRNELMNSRMSGSEEALAVTTVERLEGNAPHILIGGYGMGFTLRAALAALGPKAKITVAELLPEIIEWAREPMAELTAGCLDDPRVDLVINNVVTVINDAPAGSYDAILLDVDNGPDGLITEANGRLYSRTGLTNARAALRPGGILAIWSAAPDPAFARKIGSAGFEVDEVVVRARSNGKGPRHVIWFAKKG